MKSVTILGGGVGGLSASIYSRLKGYDVTLIEKSQDVGGKARQINQNGFLFDPGPSIIIMQWVYEDIFKAAGKDFYDYVELIPLDYLFSMITEDGKPYKFPSGKEKLFDYINQEFPEDIDSIYKIFSQIERVYPFAKKTVFSQPFGKPQDFLNLNLIKMGMKFNISKSHKDLMDDLFKSPVLRALFYGFPSYSGISYDEPSPSALFIPYIMATEGTFFPKGGVGQLIFALKELATELGVNFIFNEKLEKIETSHKQVIKVVTTKATYKSDYYISNIDKTNTLKYADVEVSDMEPSLSFATWQIGYSETLDKRFDHHTLLLPNDWEYYYNELYDNGLFSETQIVYINRTSITDKTSPDGKDNLFFVLTSPAVNGKIEWNKQDIPGVVKSNLNKFGVKVDESKIEAERVQNPIYFRENHENYKGSLYGPDKKYWEYKIFPQTNTTPHFKNLLFCGGSVQPGAGLPMSTLSGKFASSYLE